MIRFSLVKGDLGVEILSYYSLFHHNHPSIRMKYWASYTLACTIIYFNLFKMPQMRLEWCWWHFLDVDDRSILQNPSPKSVTNIQFSKWIKRSLVVSLFSPRFWSSNNFLLRLNPVLLLNCIYWNCKLYHFSCVQHVIFTSEPSWNSVTL